MCWVTLITRLNRLFTDEWRQSLACFPSLGIKISTKLRQTSALQDCIVRTLHLFMSHKLSLNTHKVYNDFCDGTHWHWLLCLGHFTDCCCFPPQAIQRKPFTSCKKHLNWGLNQKKCWRQPYRVCKQEKWTFPVWRIRKMYHVSLYVCFVLTKIIKLAVSVVIIIENLELLYNTTEYIYLFCFTFYSLIFIITLIVYILIENCHYWLCCVFLSLSQCHQTVMPMSLPKKARLSRKTVKHQMVRVTCNSQAFLFQGKCHHCGFSLCRPHWYFFIDSSSLYTTQILSATVQFKRFVFQKYFCFSNLFETFSAYVLSVLIWITSILPSWLHW